MRVVQKMRMAVRSNSVSKLPFVLTGALVAGSALAQTSTPVALPPGDVFAINAGGAATQGYSADADFTLGSTYTNTSQPVYVQDVNNAAPAAVYSTEREGDHFSYTFSGLKPGIG